MGKPSRWRRAQPIPIATEAPSQPEHGHAGGPGHARLGHVYAQQRERFVAKARNQRMRRCWPARDVAERPHSRMKQGDGGAVRKGRGAALGWILDQTEPAPHEDYDSHARYGPIFFPILRHIFRSTSWVWVQGRRTKTGLAAKHLWDGILNFGFILGSLLFWACPLHAPKMTVLWHQKLHFFSLWGFFLGTRHRCDRTVTGPGYVMGPPSGRLEWARKGFRVTSSILQLGCG